MMDKDKRSGDGSRECQGSRKRSQSLSSNDSISSSSSSSTSSDASSVSSHSDEKSRRKSSQLHRRRSRSHSGTRRQRERQQLDRQSDDRRGDDRRSSDSRRSNDRHSDDRRRDDRRGNTRGGYAAVGRDYDRYHWRAKNEEPVANETTATASVAAVAASIKSDTKTSSSKTTASASSEKKMESVASSDTQTVSNNMGPAAEVSQSQVTKPTTVTAVTVPKLQMLKTPAIIPPPPPSQPSTSSSDTATSSPFSRDNIVRNLQEMVKPVVVSVLDASRTAEELELNEKERSALEFAISMYMAANEFYDGGSLWCRQCESIFTDISALCRHIHSDKHQLVSFMCCKIVLIAFVNDTKSKTVVHD